MFIELTHAKRGETVILRLDSIKRFGYHAEKNVTLVKFTDDNGMYVEETTEQIRAILWKSDVEVFTS